MNAQTTHDDDDMPAEIGFAGAKRGQFLPGWRAVEPAGVPGSEGASGPGRAGQRQGGGFFRADQ